MSRPPGPLVRHRPGQAEARVAVEGQLGGDEAGEDHQAGHQRRGQAVLQDGFLPKKNKMTPAKAEVIRLTRFRLPKGALHSRG